jgi:serine/threonine-protein kinase
MARAEARAPQGTAVLAIDDIDQIDGASRRAFGDVQTLADGSGVWIATHEPGHDPGWRDAHTLRLSSIGVAAALDAVAERAAGELSAAGDSRALPLYLEQLDAFARERGGAAPKRLVDLVALRVERLPPAERRLLQAVAVLGDGCSFEAVARVLDDQTLDLPALATRLQAHRLLRRELDERVSAAHPFIAEVVHGSIPREVRRRLHDAALNLPAGARPLPLEARARHARYAGGTFEALMLLEQVAVQARARGDIDGSVTALRRAQQLARVELSRGQLDDPLAALLIFSHKLGDALAHQGKHVDAEGVLREALDLAGPAAHQRVRLLCSLARIADDGGDGRKRDSLLGEALEAATRGRHHDLKDDIERMMRRVAARPDPKP